MKYTQQLFHTTVITTLLCVGMVSAMEVPSVTDEHLLDLEIIKEVAPYFNKVMRLEEVGSLPRDVSNHIVLDIFSLHKRKYQGIIARSIGDFKKYCEIDRITYLYKTYGSSLAGILIKIALKEGNIAVCGGGHPEPKRSVSYFCRQSKTYPGVVEILFNAATADDKVALISAGWFTAVNHDDQELIDLFVTHAISCNKMELLLHINVLNIAVIHRNISLLGVLFECIEKLGLQEQYLTKDNYDNVMYIIKNGDKQTRDEILELIEYHFAKYRLACADNNNG